MVAKIGVGTRAADEAKDKVSKLKQAVQEEHQKLLSQEAPSAPAPVKSQSSQPQGDQSALEGSVATTNATGRESVATRVDATALLGQHPDWVAAAKRPLTPELPREQVSSFNLVESVSSQSSAPDDDDSSQSERLSVVRAQFFR